MFEDTGTDKTDRTDSFERSVPFRLEHMVMLLRAYDAYVSLERTAQKLFGEDVAVTYGHGLTGNLAYVEELIWQLSPVVQMLSSEDVDYTETELYKVLADRNMEVEEKAKRLLFPTE